MKFVVILMGFSLIVIGAIGFFVRVPQAEFNAEVWKSFRGECSREKYAMTGDLLKSDKLIGLDRNQVEDLLGIEGAQKEGDKLEFCAGHDSKFTFNRPYHLVLHFKENKAGEFRVTSADLEGPP